MNHKISNKNKYTIQVQYNTTSLLDFIGTVKGNPLGDDLCVINNH